MVNLHYRQLYYFISDILVLIFFCRTALLHIIRLLFISTFHRLSSASVIIFMFNSLCIFLLHG